MLKREWESDDTQTMGSVAEMKQTAYRLIGTNGVKHGQLLPSTTGKGI